MPAEQAEALGQQHQTQKAGKYLSFVLGGEEYALEILRVLEIIGMTDITAVPRSPSYVKGVINLRGRIIPVIDLRTKVGMTETPYDEQTCIIVADIDGVELGMIVDHVLEVLDIGADDIEDVPGFGARVDTEFILGISKAGGRLTILLDITRLLSASETSMLGMATESTQDNGLAGEDITE